jgi:hypothetical protein
MAVSLAEAAILSDNELQAAIIETFVDQSPVLARLPFMEIEGNAYQYTQESTLPGIAFRAVNAAWTESTGAFANFTEGLKIMGGEFHVDSFIQRTRSNRFDQFATQARLKAKAAAITFTERFFEGDDSIDVNSFDGLRVRLTGSQVITAGANGATLTLDMLDDLLAAVPDADALFMDEWLIRKVNRLVRSTGQVELSQREQFGRNVFQYAGVDLVPTGLGVDGVTRILGFDETQGASAVTASIYAVRFGEEEAVSGLANGGLPDVYPLGELQSKPSMAGRIEWYVGLGVFHGKAAGRLKGILQS